MLSPPKVNEKRASVFLFFALSRMCRRPVKQTQVFATRRNTLFTNKQKQPPSLVHFRRLQLFRALKTKKARPQTVLLLFFALPRMCRPSTNKHNFSSISKHAFLTKINNCPLQCTFRPFVSTQIINKEEKKGLSLPSSRSSR